MGVHRRSGSDAHSGWDPCVFVPSHHLIEDYHGSKDFGNKESPARNRISSTRATGAGKLGRRGASLRALPDLSAVLARTRSASLVLAFAPAIRTSIVAISALTETVLGGAFAGSLHAIAGPDHLAALISRCCGLPWYRAARVGAVWGLGHGVSATMLGMAGFLFKKGVRLSGVLGDMGNFDLLHHAGSFMELAIGFSLIVIGLLGIKEAREWEAPKDGCELLNDDGSVDEEKRPCNKIPMQGLDLSGPCNIFLKC